MKKKILSIYPNFASDSLTEKTSNRVAFLLAHSQNEGEKKSQLNWVKLVCLPLQLVDLVTITDLPEQNRQKMFSILILFMNTTKISNFIFYNSMPISLKSTTEHQMRAADFLLAWFQDGILRKASVPVLLLLWGIYLGWSGKTCSLSYATDMYLYIKTSTSFRGLILIPAGFGPLEQKQQLVAANLLLQWGQNPTSFILQSKFSAWILGCWCQRLTWYWISNPHPAPAVELQTSGGTKSLILWRAA